jgi:hypothetical protein
MAVAILGLALGFPILAAIILGLAALVRAFNPRMRWRR